MPASRTRWCMTARSRRRRRLPSPTELDPRRAAAGPRGVSRRSCPASPRTSWSPAGARRPRGRRSRPACTQTWKPVLRAPNQSPPARRLRFRSRSRDGSRRCTGPSHSPSRIRGSRACLLDRAGRARPARRLTRSTRDVEGRQPRDRLVRRCRHQSNSGMVGSARSTSGRTARALDGKARARRHQEGVRVDGIEDHAATSSVSCPGSWSRRRAPCSRTSRRRTLAGEGGRAVAPEVPMRVATSDGTTADTPIGAPTVARSCARHSSRRARELGERRTSRVRRRAHPRHRHGFDYVAFGTPPRACEDTTRIACRMPRC